jgi:hypothetical protein
LRKLSRSVSAKRRSRSLLMGGGFWVTIRSMPAKSV